MHTFSVTKISLIRHKAHSTIGKHAWYWKTSQSHRASNDMGIGEEPIIIPNSILNIYSIPTYNCNCFISSNKLFLEQMETSAEN